MSRDKIQRAILVNIIPPGSDTEEKMSEFDELIRLVETYGGIVILKILQKRGRPSAKTYIGEGKAREVADLVRDLKINVVVINGFLKANQSNNLINIIPCEVIDRFEMILKIFEKHAISPEAKMQLQRAYFKYEFPKLFGKGAMLSQQATGVAGVRTSGGVGGGRRAARGPGETILEIKRRHLRQQIKTLDARLEQFRKVKHLQRARRRRQEFKTAALVGYTNSGKSTLLRALTRKNAVIADKYFSTLETRLGHLHIPNTRILISDTIGFIQNLPPLLFESFLATLEEVTNSDLILHVVDLHDPKADQKIAVVHDVLNQLGCGETPILYIFNKIDLIPKLRLDSYKDVMRDLPAVFVSGLKADGIIGLSRTVKTFAGEN